VRLSILCFYRRIFVVRRQSWSNVISLIIIFISIAWLITFEFVFLFSCGVHVDATWGPLILDLEYCNQESFKVEQGFVISDLILRLAVFALPFPTIWSLNLKRERKIVVSGAFFVGSMSIAASILRLAFYEQSLTHIQWNMEGLIDYNLTETTGLWWSYLEAGLALIAACLPSLSYLQRSIPFIVAGLRSIISLRSIRSQLDHESQ